LLLPPFQDAPAEGGEAPSGEAVADEGLDLDLTSKKKWVHQSYQQSVALRSPSSRCTLYITSVLISHLYLIGLLQEEEEEGEQMGILVNGESEF
jgi:hypothetical protein